MKKIIVLFLLILFVFTYSFSIFSYASEGYTYTQEAKVLNDLGLYKGVSTETFDPDLGHALDRETGIVMLLRIFGLESDALAMSDKEANSLLAKFADAADVSDWAKKQVAYAVENGLVQGTSDTTISPKAALNGKAYCTLILRQLGYTPDYNSAPTELAEKSGLSVLEAVKFTEKDLIKDDLVGISYGSLKADCIDGKTVVEKLIDEGVVSKEVVELTGIEYIRIVSLKQPDPIKVFIGDTVTLPSLVTATYSDNTYADVAVKWSDVSTVQEGVQIVNGTVEGFNEGVKIKITVEKKPIEILSVEKLKEITVYKGDAVVFPQTITATYSDNTTKSVKVNWPLVSTSETGIQTVKGTIEGYKDGITVNVSVISKPIIYYDDGYTAPTISSAVSPDPINVNAGGTVSLPQTVAVTYSDGSTGNAAVVWPQVNTNNIGEQQVHGTISGYEQGINITVIVFPLENVVYNVTAVMPNSRVIVVSYPIEMKTALQTEEANSLNQADFEGSYQLMKNDGETVLTSTPNIVDIEYNNDENKALLYLDGEIGTDDNTFALIINTEVQNLDSSKTIGKPENDSANLAVQVEKSTLPNSGPQISAVTVHENRNGLEVIMNEVVGFGALVEIDTDNTLDADSKIPLKSTIMVEPQMQPSELLKAFKINAKFEGQEQPRDVTEQDITSVIRNADGRTITINFGLSLEAGSDGYVSTEAEGLDIRNKANAAKAKSGEDISVMNFTVPGENE